MGLWRCFPLVLFLLAAACAKPVTYAPRGSAEEVAAEEQVHEHMAAEKDLRKQERFHDKEERVHAAYRPIARAALEMCRDMGLYSPENNCVYDVKVEDSSALNAYADGSSIIVTAAMVGLAKEDEELAYILAHETAHNMMRHSSAQMRNAIAGMLVGLLVDSVAAYHGYDTHGTFTDVGSKAGVLSYSQEFEREADYIGMYLLARANYDYRHSAQIWRRMSAREPDAIYISTTHPTNPERYVAMEHIAREISGKKKTGAPLVPDVVQQTSN